MTTSKAVLRDPAKGLEYAKKAVTLTSEKQPGFLDTLAEAYYVNGEFDQAIQTEEKALAIEPGNSDYKARLEKYRKAKANEKK